MSKKLFVGNLAYSTTQQTLQDLFAEFGEIEEAVVVMDRFSGRSRGFGFVTMIDDAAADKAIEALNEKEVDGRAIIVNVARPPRERSDRPDFRQ